MPTRQELLTGVNLIRHVCRDNVGIMRLADRMKNASSYHGILDREQDMLEGFANFGVHKESVRDLCDFLSGLSFRISTVLQKVDSIYLDNGISAIPGNATRLKMVSDTDKIRDLIDKAKPLVQAASVRENLASLAATFEANVPGCEMVEPDPWKILPVEANHANILQSVLNAMKYELQGLNENTGQPHGLSLEQIKARISSRIGVGYIYHSRLTDDPEPVGVPNKITMGDVLSHVGQNLGGATSFIDLELLGQYINVSIPTVPTVRRWWAL